MKTFHIDRPTGFRLQSATDFYAQFTPGSGMAAASTDGLVLAFRLDGTFAAVAASLREEGERLVVDFAGTDDAGAVRRQVARILGLEADADAWRELGARNATVGALQREFPGFFTAAKSSPYDAATWAVIAPRMPMNLAAAVKNALARTHGDAVRLGGVEHRVFPGPEALARLERCEGLADEKVARLRGVAQAALEGRLDADVLRGMSEEVALRELQKLRGVGPWAASHIYYRGAAPVDALPTAEPRVLHGLAHALGVAAVTPEDFVREAEGWRPYRMWVAVLLSRHLARTDGWRSPGLAEERTRSGRALAKRVCAGRAREPGLPSFHA